MLVAPLPGEDAPVVAPFSDDEAATDFMSAMSLIGGEYHSA